MSAVAVPLRARRPGVGAVYRWEVRKLLAQKRTYIGLGAAVAVPLIFVIALLADNRGDGPDGLPFGEFVRETGFAVPLVCLAFGAFWLLPLITALVAGDIVATEDQNGTLKTILTRSVERWQVFAGKVLAALTYTAALLLLYVGIAAGGGRPDLGLRPPRPRCRARRSGPGRALLLTGAGTLAYLLPMSAIAAIGVLLSTLTRNSAAAVVGTLMVSIFVQIIGSISALDAARPVPALDPVQRLAGHPARADRLGSDRALGLGLRPVRGAVDRLGADRVRAKGRRRRVTRISSELDATPAQAAVRPRRDQGARPRPGAPVGAGRPPGDHEPPPQHGIVLAVGPGIDWWESAGVEMPVEEGRPRRVPGGGRRVDRGRRGAAAGLPRGRAARRDRAGRRLGVHPR